MEPVTSEWLLPRMLARLSDDRNIMVEPGPDGTGSSGADRMALIALIERAADADLVRDMLALAARRATATDRAAERPLP